MKFIIGATIPLMLLGCASYDLATSSTLEPIDDDTYRWRTLADNIYPVSSQRAEAQRLEQLGKVMSLNCPGTAHVIEDRKTTKKIDSGIGDGIYDVFYTVRCN